MKTKLILCPIRSFLQMKPVSFLLYAERVLKLSEAALQRSFNIRLISSRSSAKYMLSCRSAEDKPSSTM